jgi:hypothetical protein
MDEPVSDESIVAKNFKSSAFLLIANETVAVQIQELFNSLAGPTKDFRHNPGICLEEAACFVDDKNFNPCKDKFYLRLYTADGSDWKVTDLKTKLLDLTDPNECETAIKVEQYK